MPKLCHLAAGVASLGLSVFAGAASAQTQDFAPRTMLDSPIPFVYDRGENVGVNDRVRPELQPTGVRAGGFIVFPQLSTRIGYTDNVYTQPDNTVGDGFVSVDPSVKVRSDWAVHRLELNASGSFRRYFNQTIRNQSGYNVSATGRIDLSPALVIATQAGTARLFESQFSGGAIANTSSAVPYQRTLASIRATYVSGQVRLIGAADYTDFSFKPVTTLTDVEISQSNRSREIYRGTAQAEYGLSPSISVFVQGNYSDTKYDERLNPTTANRDSNAYQFLAGVTTDINALIRGSFGIGYMRRDYDAPIYNDLSGLSVEAQLEWFVTQLTTVTVSGRRRMEDSLVTNSSGYYNNGGAIQVDHELLRNLLLRAGLDYEKDIYRGIDSKAEVFRVLGSARYLMNRNMTVGGELTYGDRSSSGVTNGPVFSETRGVLTFSVQM